MSILRAQSRQGRIYVPLVEETNMCDFEDYYGDLDIGEGVYYSNEENQMDIEEHPTDILIKELEEIE